MKLSELKPGQIASISEVGGKGALRTHLLDMGLTPGTDLRMVKKAPFGDPVEVHVRGYSLSLRLAEASLIKVVTTDVVKSEVQAEDDSGYTMSMHGEHSHPGYGEEGRYHRHEDEKNALPKDARLSFALIGQPNCGKITLFNVLTANRRIGPLVTNLPAIYSLNPYTESEAEVGDFLRTNRPSCIINVVDANNMERNLYLTLQLMALDIPMVLALNMMDEVRGNGGGVRINEMESMLGIPVVPVSAIRHEGVDELVSHAMHVARYQEAPACPESLSLPDDSMPDRDAALADMRFAFIEKVCRRTVIRPSESRESRRSRILDRVLTGKWTALPIFFAIMSLILWLTIDVIGAPLQQWLANAIDYLGIVTDNALCNAGAGSLSRSLVHDCFFVGVGAVLSFVPIIVTLFFFLSLLEGSGYMSRVAFVTDRMLCHLGLSGRSIAPLLIGLGCSVPAVMSTRTLPSSHDRRLTIFLIPFMSCSAKIPIYAFLAVHFFPGHGGLVLVCLYLLGVFMGILTAVVRRIFKKESETAPFVMELPNYRIPAPRNVAKLLWEKTMDFIQGAVTVIFLATVVIWLLQSFDFHLRLAEGGEGSMLAQISGLLAPIFQPLGLGDWRIVTTLITGFMRKEGIVASMQVLGGVSLLDTASAVSMLVFCLLYTPCVSTIAAVRRELGGKSAAYMVVFQCVMAWTIAFAAYRVAFLFLR